MNPFRKLKAPKGMNFDRCLIKDDRAIIFLKKRRMKL